ncbi:MAG TPA: hypothetical protein VHB54_03575 [Mucilaginibacter sp.]|nr:hypothetical protein [Mucilaginibacter sp.]
MRLQDEIELLPDNLADLEVEFRKIQIQEYLYNISERKKYRKWSFAFALLWILFIAFLFVISPLGDTYLSKGIYTAVASTGTFQVFKLLNVTIRPLYDNKV